jgi:NAD+ synthase
MTMTLRLDAAKTCSSIEAFIRESVLEAKRDGVVLGLSGGIDSCVLAHLASRAVGPENVLCVMLPDKHSSRVHKRHARMVIAQLGTRYRVESITSKLNKFGTYRMVPRWVPRGLVMHMFRDHMRKVGESSFSAGLVATTDPWVARANAFYRVKHRMRMVVLYYVSDTQNLLVAGAANKTEHAIGLFIKFGCDSASDIMPIACLYKTQVRQIAAHVGVPQEIIDKPPSADLMPGITDEFVMGVTYETLDLVLLGLDLGLSLEEIVTVSGCDAAFPQQVQQWMDQSRHKREAPYFSDRKVSQAV